MKAISLIGSVAVILMAITQAGATTYTYTGNVFGNSPEEDYYVSATVNLICAGSCLGTTYALGANLASFTLSIDNTSNVPVFTASSSDPAYTPDGVPDYLTLSSAGVVTNWQLYLDNGSLNTIAIYTIGYDTSDGTEDLFAAGNYQSGTGFPPNPGIWSGPGITGQVSATPLPSTWTMLIAGFVGLFGFVAFGGKKRNAAATVAA
jgi:hypothetical protein